MVKYSVNFLKLLNCWFKSWERGGKAGVLWVPLTEAGLVLNHCTLLRTPTTPKTATCKWRSLDLGKHLLEESKHLRASLHLWQVQWEDQELAGSIQYNLLSLCFISERQPPNAEAVACFLLTGSAFILWPQNLSYYVPTRQTAATKLNNGLHSCCLSRP